MESDLIRKQDALDSLGERPPVWTGSDYELGQRNQYDLDKLHLELVPSAQPETNCSEFPNNSDTISRQAVLNMLHRECSTMVEDFLRNKINAIPSAQPEPKMGKWIDVPHTFFTKCSACEWLNDIHDFDYCPNCGARMKEGE